MQAGLDDNWLPHWTAPPRQFKRAESRGSRTAVEPRILAVLACLRVPVSCLTQTGTRRCTCLMPAFWTPGIAGNGVLVRVRSLVDRSSCPPPLRFPSHEF